MKLALVLLFSSITAAAAPPQTPQLVTIEVERDQVGGPFVKPLPLADAEPGGLLVTATADPSWFAIGLQAGDVIRSQDGTPAAGRTYLRDGVNVLEIERGGKLYLYRVVIHGPPLEKAHLRETDFVDLVKRLSDPEPRTTVVKKGGVPSGVRVLDLLLQFNLELSVGDIVRTIDGVAIQSNAAFVAALQNLRIGQTEMLIERDGRAITIELWRDAPIELKSIKRVSATKFEVPRAIVEAITNDAFLAGRKVETVPVVDAGVVRGLRVYNIERDSLCATLGLVNDDIILDVEGRSIATFESAVETMHALSDAASVTVHVERKRKRIAITYVIR